MPVLLVGDGCFYLESVVTITVFLYQVLAIAESHRYAAKTTEADTGVVPKRKSS